jgi:predicted porin
MSALRARSTSFPTGSLSFKFENGFNPYTLQRANGPKSLVENNTTPLDAQTANGDSSRAGQLFNTESYIGFSNPTYGELLARRQNSLIVDGASRFDPMGAASSFSVLGVSNTVAGGGDTETARYNTSLKYRLGVGSFNFVGLYQFGGFDQGNGSNRAISLRMTGDFGPLTFGMEGRRTKTRSRCPISLNFRFHPA